MGNFDKTKKYLASGLMLAVSLSAWSQTSITDEAGLKAIANNLAGSYVLANDITLSGEWAPIGTSDAPFTGTLDGAGHAIKGLTITSGEDNIGFFGFTNGATIKRIQFTGAKVFGNKQAAIVAGQAINSSIDQVFTSGYVTGYDHVGGIVGDARGDSSSDEMTYITNCLSTAGAYSTTYQAGNIAGWTNAGVFENNIVQGSVTARYGGAGGVTGMIDNNGLASYVGNVSAAALIDGASTRVHAINAWKNGSGCMVGEDADNLSSDKTIYMVGGNVVTVDELTNSSDFEGIQGTTTADADLKVAGTYSAIGFGSAWNLATGSYPALAYQTLPIDGDIIKINEVPDKFVIGTTFETGAVSPMGRTVNITSSNESVVSVNGTTLSFDALGNSTVTLSTSGDNYCAGASVTLNITVSNINYAITTPEDLQNMKYDLAGDFTLENDIDMTGFDWTPVGDFTGTFDGKGHYIKNISYNNANQGEVAVFSITRDATIKNLGVMNANFVGNANVAAVVGRAYGGLIEGCAAVGCYIEGRDHVASICGDVNINSSNEGAVVRNCISDSEIYSRSYQAGGIVGTIVAGTVENNLFSGIVDCPGSNATGMVSLIDADTYPSIIQNNFVAASHLIGNVNRIVATAGRACTLLNNYVLASTYCGSSLASAGVMDNQSDPTSTNGANATETQARSKNFYESTLGWDFNSAWKFLEGAEGKMYPVLQWMNAPLPSRIYDMPQDKAILYVEGMEYINLNCIHGSWGQTLNMEITSGGNIACILDGMLWAGDEDGNFAGRGDVVVTVTPTDDVASLFTMSEEDNFSVLIGREGDLTEISTAQDFIDINKNLAGDYILVNDIDMRGVDFSGIAVSGEAFTGSLDGDGHRVIGAKVSYSSGNDKGIFGTTNGATFRNIAFQDFVVSASSSNHVGFIGTATMTTFDQCAFLGTVTGDDHVAILAGDGDGSTVTNCYVDGSVRGGSQIGGFFGCTLESGANISNSYYNGTAAATYRGWVGGFIGLIDKANSQIDLNNCVSIGNCSATGSGSPLVTAPFIAGNNAGNTPNAVVNFSNNIYNIAATMDASTEWPSKNTTMDGGNVQNATSATPETLQSAAVYEGLGWDFDNIWSFDTASGYLYPVLKNIGAVLTGIQSINDTMKGSSTYAVHAAGNVLTVDGLGGKAAVTVTTLSGQNVASKSTSAASATVTLPGKGIYIVKVVENGVAKAVKVINR